MKNRDNARISFDESLGVYTPEEIWTFDLLFDVLAWLGTLDSLTRQDRARTASSLQSLDLSARHHHWKKALKKAGAGPVAGHEVNLPFVPTNAQTRVATDIVNDLASIEPMLRLVQGDVGSGKTVVAALAAVSPDTHPVTAAADVLNGIIPVTVPKT